MRRPPQPPPPPPPPRRAVRTRDAEPSLERQIELQKLSFWTGLNQTIEKAKALMDILIEQAEEEIK